MIQINFLIVKKGLQVEAVSKDVLTYLQFKTNIEVNTTTYAFLENDKVIDLNHFFALHPQFIIHNGTWSDVSNDLTDLNIQASERVIDIPKRYRTTSGFTNIEGSVVNNNLEIYSLTHHDDFDLGYGNYGDNASVNNQLLRNRFNDIFVDKNPKNTLDFSSTLLSINGLLTYPSKKDGERTWFENTLSLAQNRNDFVLLDFKNLGFVKTIPLSETTYTKNKSNFEVTFNEDIDKTIIPVIEGSIVLEGATKVGEKSIKFFKDVYKSAVHRKQLQNKFVYNTNNIVVNENDFDDDDSINFFIVLDKNISIIKTPAVYDIDHKIMKFPLNTRGLMLNTYNNVIIDYSYQDESDYTVAFPKIYYPHRVSSSLGSYISHPVELDEALSVHVNNNRLEVIDIRGV